MSIPIISLFCGCGGFDSGFTQAGFNVVRAFDNDEAVIASYNYNCVSPVAQLVDLAVTPASDILNSFKKEGMISPKGIIGGAPCQTFSRGNSFFNPDHVKHSLPARYAEILELFNQEYDLDFFVFENVNGITYQKHKATFNNFISAFQAAGFSIYQGILDAVDFGVPQYRPRVFVVGLNEAKYQNVDFHFPIPNCDRPRTVRSVLSNLPEPVFFRRKLSSQDIPFHPNHWTMVPKSEKFHNGFLKEGCKKGRSFRVLSWDQPSWTVAYGNREIHVHPSGRRRLSIYEAMRIQGLPHDFRLIGNFTEQVNQVSDTIPPQLGFAIGRAVIHSIESAIK